MKNKRVAIVGGGASGMIAAIFAAKSGNIVTIFEKNDRIGKKILQTGNGRCNLTNKNLSTSKYNNPSFVEKIFNKFGEKDIEKFFESIGLVLTSDEEGRVYPQSFLASSVLDVLRAQIEIMKIKVQTDFCVEKITKHGEKFQINSSKELFDKIVISMCDTDHNLLSKFGHQIVKTRPALTSLCVEKSQIRGLAGVRQTAKISAKIDGKMMIEEGEVQFKENEISGICIFNFSCFLARRNNYKCKMIFDFLPKFSSLTLKSMLFLRKKVFSNMKIENFLVGIFHKNLSKLLLEKVFDLKNERLCESIADNEIVNLCETIKNYSIDVLSGTKQGQITCGGYDVEQINENMESKLISGLFFCGEVVDIDGECGGYNLSWAWASGKIAGEN